MGIFTKTLLPLLMVLTLTLKIKGPLKNSGYLSVFNKYRESVSSSSDYFCLLRVEQHKWEKQKQRKGKHVEKKFHKEEVYYGSDAEL